MADFRHDRVLVERAQSGEMAAFEELLSHYRERLRTLIARRMGPGLRARLEPDDVLQDTVTKAFQLLDRFEWRGPDSLFRWLSAIAEHLVLNATRKHSKAPFPLEIDVEAASQSPSTTMRRNERFDRLSAALDRLSATQREALLLARIEGLRVEEVARRLNKSPEAVKKTITRALYRLRTAVGETESLHLPDRTLGKSEED